MSTVLDRWGNSIGIRLPKSVVEAAGFQLGDRVDVGVEGGSVVIRHARPRYSLDELLIGMTPESTHAEFEFGDSVGAERVWDAE